MQPYSIDLRTRIVEFVDKGGSKAEAARRFNVCRMTAHRYVNAQHTGGLSPKPQGGSKPRLDSGRLRREVQRHPDATPQEYGKTFGVSHVAVWHRLRQLAITLKKKRIAYRERDEVQRWLFRREMESLAGRPVFFLDESGVDHRLHKAYARAPRGEAVYASVHGARRGRTSVISASRGGKLVSPFVFEGHCNGDIIEAYFAQSLLPSIPKGSVVVLDNASFHRPPRLQAIVEAAGCSLMFLPAYSPDLNPIEHIWATLKRLLQDRLPKAKNKRLLIERTCLRLCA